MGGGNIKLNHQFVLSQLVKLYIINDAHILSGYTRKRSGREPSPQHWLFGKVVYEITRRHGPWPARSCRPWPAFPRRAHHRSFAAHTQFSPGCLWGLCQRPAAGRRPIRGGRRRPPHIDTALRKDRGPAADAAGPLLYGGTAKNTPITRTDDGRVLRLVQNHAGKCADAITCGGS